MAKTMKITAALSLLLFALSLGRNLSLSITFGTISYHLLMRLAVGWSIDRKMQNRADLSKSCWQLRPWERALYKKLQVKRWKASMPSYEPELFSPEKHSWHEIAQAMCQAELVHRTIIPLSFLPLLAAPAYGAFPVFLVTSTAAAMYDGLFVIMQRYNRPRVMRLAEREKRAF